MTGVPLKIGVTAETAALILDMSPNTFRRRVREGVFPPAKVVGGKRLWPVRLLEQALLDAPDDISAEQGRDNSEIDEAINAA